MNKRILTKLAIFSVLAVLVLKLDVLGGVFALVFLGMIPGTNLSIPPAVMMIAYPLIIIATVNWLTHQPLYIGSQEKQEKTARAIARKRVAKKAAATRTRRRYRKAEA